MRVGTPRRFTARGVARIYRVPYWLVGTEPKPNVIVRAWHRAWRYRPPFAAR